MKIVLLLLQKLVSFYLKLQQKMKLRERKGTVLMFYNPQISSLLEDKFDMHVK